MIEGLKLDFPADEVKNHALQRQEHHSQRGDFYEQQANALESGASEGGNVGNAFSNSTSGDPVKSLRNQAVGHRVKAKFFELIGSHLIVGETYRLSEDDLSRYEFSSGRFY